MADKVEKEKRNALAELIEEMEADVPLALAAAERYLQEGDSVKAFAIAEEYLKNHPDLHQDVVVQASIERLVNGFLRIDDGVVPAFLTLCKMSGHDKLSQVVGAEQLRQNLRAAAEQSGMSYVEIGNRMGFDDAETAKNRVNYLINRTTDPGILTVLSFCRAVRCQITDILKS